MKTKSIYSDQHFVPGDCVGDGPQHGHAIQRRRALGILRIETLAELSSAAASVSSNLFDEAEEYLRNGVYVDINPKKGTVVPAHPVL